MYTIIYPSIYKSTHIILYSRVNKINQVFKTHSRRVTHQCVVEELNLLITRKYYLKILKKYCMDFLPVTNRKSQFSDS